MLTLSQSYYEPNKSRPNLHVLTGAYVTRIILDSTATSVVATGAQFLHDGKDYTVNAKREIILSAGELNILLWYIS